MLPSIPKSQTRHVSRLSRSQALAQLQSQLGAGAAVLGSRVPAQQGPSAMPWKEQTDPPEEPPWEGKRFLEGFVDQSLNSLSRARMVPAWGCCSVQCGGLGAESQRNISLWFQIPPWQRPQPSLCPFTLCCQVASHGMCFPPQGTSPGVWDGDSDLVVISALPPGPSVPRGSLSARSPWLRRL